MLQKSKNSFKLVLLGQSQVGKSAIVQRLVKDSFSKVMRSTIGACYHRKTIMLTDTNETVNLEIWDTAGEEKYHSIAPMYYRNAHAAIIVYDITDLKSFFR